MAPGQQTDAPSSTAGTASQHHGPVPGHTNHDRCFGKSMCPDCERLSRKMGYLLRHAAKEKNIPMDDQHYVWMDTLLAYLEQQKDTKDVQQEDVTRIIQRSWHRNMPRFEMYEKAEGVKVRATGDKISIPDQHVQSTSASAAQPHVGTSSPTTPPQPEAQHVETNSRATASQPQPQLDETSSNNELSVLRTEVSHLQIILEDMQQTIRAQNRNIDAMSERLRECDQWYALNSTEMDRMQKTIDNQQSEIEYLCHRMRQWHKWWQENA